MILYGLRKGTIVRANDAYPGETYFCEHCGAKMYVKTSTLGNKFYALYHNEEHTKAPCMHMMRARQTHSRVAFNFAAFMAHTLSPVRRAPARDPKLPEIDSVPAQNPFADEMLDEQSAQESNGSIGEAGAMCQPGDLAGAFSGAIATADGKSASDAQLGNGTEEEPLPEKPFLKLSDMWNEGLHLLSPDTQLGDGPLSNVLCTFRSASRLVSNWDGGPLIFYARPFRAFELKDKRYAGMIVFDVYWKEDNISKTMQLELRVRSKKDFQALREKLFAWRDQDNNTRKLMPKYKAVLLCGNWQRIDTQYREVARFRCDYLSSRQYYASRQPDNLTDTSSNKSQ